MNQLVTTTEASLRTRFELVDSQPEEKWKSKKFNECKRSLRKFPRKFRYV